MTIKELSRLQAGCLSDRMRKEFYITGEICNVCTSPITLGYTDMKTGILYCGDCADITVVDIADNETKYWTCEICAKEKNFTKVQCFVFENEYRKVCHTCLKQFLDGELKQIGKKE